MRNRSLTIIFLIMSYVIISDKISNFARLIESEFLQFVICSIGYVFWVGIGTFLYSRVKTMMGKEC
ncbi:MULTISPECIES: hypothetical protein [Bacillus cereus group]|uniref:Uncharacterized protein n=1 Tax=Bacillus cereus TaxID=1396 RepID=A0A9X6W2H9_BACCE|nr:MULTISPECIES: hypothetical protein [Bacillus cereus group]PFF51835.1 hypothetical protein CN357_03850 [Bacillus cereus]PGB10040.1 hypothetical protein COM09_23495 [Bacillus toyonensis]